MDKTIFKILLFLLPNLCLAQTDSINHLQEIIIYKPIKLENIGVYTQQIDSNKMQNNVFGSIQNQLTANTHFYIKNYGSNSLATISVRGSSASQVATIWNGFNINMLSTSLVDMSLIPSFFVDKILIQYGSTVAQNSSGAIGASLQLQSNLPFAVGSFFRIGIQEGSFASHNINTQYFYSNARFVNSTKIIYGKAKNNFKYWAMDGSDTQKQMANNQFVQMGILQENKFIINKKMEWTSGIWLQHTNRNLPPSVTSTNQNENQIDDSYRAYLNLYNNFGNFQQQTKVAFSKEGLDYSNQSLQINAQYITNRFLIENKHSTKIKNGFLNATLQYNYGQMIANEFTKNAFQNRFGISLDYTKAINKFIISGSTRQEFIRDTKIPFVYNLGAFYKPKKYFEYSLSANRVFRLPTFNDLFWAGTGNPNLKPESGIALEAGINFNYTKPVLENSIEVISNPKSITKNKTNLGLHFFNRNINNWIVWLTNANNIWTPQNILQVWSRGLEVNANQTFNIKKINMQATILYTYVKSTNVKVDANQQNEIDKQLIYTPIHNTNFNLDFEYKNIQLLYQQQLISKRFTTTDNNNFLPSYTITNLQIKKNIVFNTNQINIGFGVNNLFNANYQVINYRPMPFRNYFLSGNLFLHQTNKKNKK